MSGTESSRKSDGQGHDDPLGTTADDFETRKWLADGDFRQRELAIKEAELALKQQEQASAQWKNPLLVGIAAATFTGLLNVWATFENHKHAADLEHERWRQSASEERRKGQVSAIGQYAHALMQMRDVASRARALGGTVSEKDLANTSIQRYA